jgi:plastocyanin
MNPGRRSFIQASGGLLLAGMVTRATLSHAGEPIDIAMMGVPGGARVWFRPIGLLIEVGQTVRWTNRDPGNSHTATAYHPSLYKKAQRIPDGAQAWDSGFLLPEESFSHTFTVPGVYDYYCLPHEHAGMVGRIIVSGAAADGWLSRASSNAGLPDIALQTFPTVERIMRDKIVQ